jgi:hypothetical protein
VAGPHGFQQLQLHPEIADKFSTVAV